jgi:hypothetical protein
LPAFDVVAGCFGEEDKADYKYASPKSLDDDWDPIASRVVSVMSGVIDDGSEQKPCSKGELIAVEMKSA